MYLVNVPISLITAIFYNKIITNGYCFDPHLPQNFAAGFSLAPQLSQNEDVGLVSASFGLGL
jgi:branched-subunit amino acid transport protein